MCCTEYEVINLQRHSAYSSTQRPGEDLLQLTHHIEIYFVVHCSNQAP